MQFANIAPLIGNLCTKAEGGVDVEMFRALHDDMSLDDALDMAEILEVWRSWNTAAEMNADEKRAIESKKRQRRQS